MLKVIIDFLSSQGDTILEAPVPFIVIFVIGFAFGWFVNSSSQKNRIETNEERLKLKEEQIKEKDTKIQVLEQRLGSQGELKQKSNSVSLSEDEIRALKAISRFEDENPFQPPKPPPEYSVDHVATDLKIDWGEANEILKKLRRLGLFESIWENLPTFPNLNRPVNETRSGRLSKTGRDFLRNYRNGD